MRSEAPRRVGFRLVLLAILTVMALMADTRFASAAPGGAEQVAVAPPADGAIGTTTWDSPPAKAYEIEPGPAP